MINERKQMRIMKTKLIVLCAVAAVAAACTADIDDAMKVAEAELDKAWSGADVIGNTLYVKFDRETADGLSVTRTRSGELMTGNLTIDDLCSRYKVVSMERVFAPDHCEERMRNAGLDLWYSVVVEDEIDSKPLAAELKSLSVTSAMQPARRIQPGEYYVRYATESDLQVISGRSKATRADGALSFNDPLLREQWMLKNDGSVFSNRGVAGADINVAGAWEKCTGNPNVIVAVVDNGMDYSHPDLKANMWYDIGRNFVGSANGNKVFRAGEHGTHVAGTIAAVGNNGIGIAGIAGGNGTKDSGVKIMNCQIFEGTGGSSDAWAANAITFAANNGAVICNNSWGYKTIRNLEKFEEDYPLVKAAIDYFVKNAGMSSDGKTQEGPMAGGVLFFAAGNDGVYQQEYPASYEPCYSVASITCNYNKAWYSSYDETVDFCAPGGGGWNSGIDFSMQNSGYSGYNLSLLPTSMSQSRPQDGYYFHSTGYGWIEGTSMACPHVSGVAALIVSYCGGPGFTAEKLKEIMFNSSRDVSMPPYQSSNIYENRLGLLVDAAKALELGKPGGGGNTPGPGGEGDNPGGNNPGGNTQDSDAAKVSFYPNPCKDTLYILFEPADTSAALSDGHIKVYNSIGAVVFDATFKPKYGTVADKDTNTSLDVRGWNIGRYVVEVEYRCGGTTHKTSQTIIKN